MWSRTRTHVPVSAPMVAARAVAALGPCAAPAPGLLAFPQWMRQAAGVRFGNPSPGERSRSMLPFPGSGPGVSLVCQGLQGHSERPWDPRKAGLFLAEVCRCFRVPPSAGEGWCG